MKKDKEKKKDGKSSKSTKELSTGGAVGGELTSDDLVRLDEVRRSLKIGKPRRKEKEKLPSGITADYTAHLGITLVVNLKSSFSPTNISFYFFNLFLGLNLAGTSPSGDLNTRQSALGSPLSDESETTSVNSFSTKPETAESALLPVPPSRGILKGIFFFIR